MAANPIEAADIFVSYSRLDRPWVRSLVSGLEAMGWTVWWDRKLTVGEEYDDEIDERLTSARAVIVVWSENSVKRTWVKAEANEARERGTLVPVLKDGSRPPLVFRGYHTVDLSSWDGAADDPEYSSLLTAITQRVKGALTGDREAAETPPPATAPSERARSTVEVGTGLEADDIEVEEVVGEELDGSQVGSGSVKVDVLKDAKLSRAKLGKITGRTVKSGPDDDRSGEGDR